jgi:hypothetical protein
MPARERPDKQQRRDILISLVALARAEWRELDAQLDVRRGRSLLSQGLVVGT